MEKFKYRHLKLDASLTQLKCSALSKFWQSKSVILFLLCRKCLHFSNSLLAKNVVRFLARVVSIHHKIVSPESAEVRYLVFT